MNARDKLSRYRIRAAKRLGDFGGSMPGFGRLDAPRRRSMLVRMAVGFAAANMFLCLCALAVSALVGALAWPYAINEWLVFAGRPPAMEPLHGALIGLVPGFGQAALPVAVVTWIVMLFLGG